MSARTTSIPPLLDALLHAHGPSGHEHLAFDAVRAAAAEIPGAEVETDTVGNLLVRRAGQGGGPSLAVFAHLDVIGLAVAHVRDDGLLTVHTLGTWRAGVGYGQRVEIATRDGLVPGVIAAVSKDNEKKEWSDLLVDVGARDGADARRLVRPGDPMVVAAAPVALANGRVASRSLDNRACVYVALEALRRLAEEPPAADVTVVAGAHEELGHAGAAAATHRLRPDVALVLDVTYATDVPAGDPAEGGDHRLGGGPALFRGPAVSPRLFELLVGAAEAEGVAHTIEAGMKTYTDADDTYLSRGGVATALVSVPLRNMHSPIEIVDLGDLEACVQLVAAFARRLEPGLDLRRS